MALTMLSDLRGMLIHQEKKAEMKNLVTENLSPILTSSKIPPPPFSGYSSQNVNSLRMFSLKVLVNLVMDCAGF